MIKLVSDIDFSSINRLHKKEITINMCIVLIIKMLWIADSRNLLRGNLSYEKI